jgi:hypothetical protein
VSAVLPLCDDEDTHCRLLACKVRAPPTPAHAHSVSTLLPNATLVLPLSTRLAAHDDTALGQALGHLHTSALSASSVADAQRSNIIEMLRKRASAETEARYIVRMAATHALAQAPLAAPATASAHES